MLRYEYDKIKLLKIKLVVKDGFLTLKEKFIEKMKVSD